MALARRGRRLAKIPRTWMAHPRLHIASSPFNLAPRLKGLVLPVGVGTRNECDTAISLQELAAKLLGRSDIQIEYRWPFAAPYRPGGATSRRCFESSFPLQSMKYGLC